MLDFVDHYRAEGATLQVALTLAGARRLRPVLMTSMAAALGMLPLAVAVTGSLAISVLLSLVATPVLFSLMHPRRSSGVDSLPGDGKK